MQHVSLGSFARGCTFLGSGGGGSTRMFELLLTAQGVDDLHFRAVERADDPVAVALFGSVDVFAEMLPAGAEAVLAVRMLQDWLGREFTGVVPLQVGGTSGLIAAQAALALGKDLVDADLVGRATQKLGQITLCSVPGGLALGVASPTGASAVFCGDDTDHLERFARALIKDSVGWLVLALAPRGTAMHPGQMVCGSLSAASKIGEALDWAPSGASMQRYDAVAPELRRRTGIEYLAAGRIHHHLRYRSGAGTEVESYQLLGAGGAAVRVEATSEYLVAVVDGIVVARTPEVIQVVDRLTLRPIMVQDLRVGNEVVVLTREAPEWWRDHPEAQARLGPAAYGLDDAGESQEEP